MMIYQKLLLLDFVLKSFVINGEDTMIFKYWNFVGSLAEIENYVKVYENEDWNCDPIKFEADV